MEKKKLKRIEQLLMVLTILIAMSSCATIFKGSQKTIYINSNPGAKLTINGVDYGQTGKDVKIKRKLKRTIVEISKEGYQTETFKLEKSFASVSLLNIIGLYGFVVDIATGAIAQYDTHYYDIDLKLVEFKK